MDHDDDHIYNICMQTTHTQRTNHIFLSQHNRRHHQQQRKQNDHDDPTHITLVGFVFLIHHAPSINIDMSVFKKKNLGKKSANQISNFN